MPFPLSYRWCLVRILDSCIPLENQNETNNHQNTSLHVSHVTSAHNSSRLSVPGVSFDERRETFSFGLSDRPSQCMIDMKNKTKQMRKSQKRSKTMSCPFLCIIFSHKHTQTHFELDLENEIQASVPNRLSLILFLCHVTTPISSMTVLSGHVATNRPIAKCFNWQVPPGGLNLPVVFVIAVDLKSDKMLCVNSSRLLGEPVYLWNIK